MFKLAIVGKFNFFLKLVNDRAIAEIDFKNFAWVFRSLWSPGLHIFSAI